MILGRETPDVNDHYVFHNVRASPPRPPRPSDSQMRPKNKMSSPDESSPAQARAPDPERPPRFQPQQELGKGQFGTTYLVSHKVTKREAACKAIAKRKLVSAEDIEDVRREISILHHLGDHPNVVELIDAYEGSKHIYIVMDCEGGELFDRIVARAYSEKANGHLPDDDRAARAVQPGRHPPRFEARELRPKDDGTGRGDQGYRFGLSTY